MTDCCISARIIAFGLDWLHRLEHNCTYMDTSNPLLRREGAFSAAWDRTDPKTLQG